MCYPFQLLKKECVKMVSKKIEMIGIFIIAILFSMVLVFGAIISIVVSGSLDTNLTIN